jgi:hypothetical protein
MACPYFFPMARLDQGSWAIPPRLPLGDAYAGECRASGGAFQPDDAHVREICNVGYGRGCCGRFPQDVPADAVRFHVIQDAGAIIRIHYVFERDCWPVKSGVIECLSASREIRGSEDATLQSQALAFVESYWRRKSVVLGTGA